MNNQDKKVPTQCGLSTLQRPYYSPGQLLDDDDLNTGVTFTWDLTRTLFRSLFGCGVICGLQVTPSWTCGKTKWSITVSKGLALDCMGDPIELPVDATMTYGPDCQNLPPALWVTICYIEKCCRPKDVTCSQSDDPQSKPTRVRAGYEIRLYDTLPKCACHCPTQDDNPAPPAPGHECCDDAPQPAGTAAGQDPQADSTTPTICDCFKSHFEGDCECGCNCKCVVLGKITVPTKDDKGANIDPANQVPTTDTSMVRRIRPLLNGYIDCGSLKLVDLKRQRKRASTRERKAQIEVEPWDERAEETDRE
jgi:hypothetical protein